MKMIKINERFECERDQYGWKLHEWRDGKDKDGNSKLHKSTTYHATLEQICSVVVDRSAGSCQSAAELRALLMDAERLLVGKVEAISG